MPKEETQTTEKVKLQDVGKLELSAEALQTLLSTVVSSAVEQAVARTAQITSKAIEESKKPYKDPLQEQNDEAMRRSMREQRERDRVREKISQRNCPHLQGSNPLSDFSSNLTSIVQHVLDSGEMIGICTNCLRVFREGDPDYVQWMQKKSGNRTSSAGQRFMIRTRVPEPQSQAPTPDPLAV